MNAVHRNSKHYQVKENTYLHACETSTTNFKNSSEFGTNDPFESQNLSLDVEGRY